MHKLRIFKELRSNGVAYNSIGPKTIPPPCFLTNSYMFAYLTKHSFSRTILLESKKLRSLCSTSIPYSPKLPPVRLMLTETGKWFLFLRYISTKITITTTEHTYLLQDCLGFLSNLSQNIDQLLTKLVIPRSLSKMLCFKYNSKIWKILKKQTHQSIYN